jgi:hypothetical protein
MPKHPSTYVKGHALKSVPPFQPFSSRHPALRSSLLYLTALAQEIMTCDVIVAFCEAAVTVYSSLTRALRHDGRPRIPRNPLVYMDVRASATTTTRK